MTQPSLEQQLDAYRAAGAGRPVADPVHWTRYAAAVGSALAYASGADATTIYDLTPSSTAFVNLGTATVNLDGGLPDITFNFNTLGTAWTMNAGGFGIAATLPSGQAINMQPGAMIDDSLTFLTQANVLSLATLSTNNGNFGVGTPGYLGIKTDQGNFAWIRLKFTSTNGDKFPELMTVVATGYNDNGQPLGVPSPAPLSLLAIGGAGLIATRRRSAARQRQAAHG